VVLGYNVSDGHGQGRAALPLFTLEDLNGRELVAYQASGYEGNLAPLQQAAAAPASSPSAPTPTAWCVLLAAAAIGDGYYPSLSLATAAVYLQARAIKPTTRQHRRRNLGVRAGSRRRRIHRPVRAEGPVSGSRPATA
jgi:adenylate cyclase